MSGPCTAHAERPAVYECDGCKKLLCEECIEAGHRLLLCRHCGELAVPLAGAPATATELERERRITAAYGLGDALAYPFRGLGRYVFIGYALLLVIFAVLGAVPGLGCAVLLVRLFIGLLVPGLLFAIVRGSAEGETELPDWPEWSDVGERLGEWVAFLLVMLMAGLPAWLLLRLGGCSLEELVFHGWGSGCWLLVVLGTVVGAALFVPGMGAVGAYGSGWLGWRADLHLKALLALGGEAWRTIGLLALLWLGSLLLNAALAFVPILGQALLIVLGVYSLLLAPHLIGLLFRRNTKTLEAIYLG